ncbi:MAG: type I methionyl aminopeptidase [Candidatus Brocadiaceae bacterium]|nr:type I methionyl aminopeptidase [Candidatus Brocadiaceae bacterium]
MTGIEVKTPAQVAQMRQAGRLVAEVLDLVAGMARAGVTTEQLDRAAEGHIVAGGGRPSFKGYRGFPASICASLNEEVVHGIPGARVLCDGDLLKVDVGAQWQGYHADAAVTVPIGDVSAEAQRLLETTRAALYAGIAAVRAGVRVSQVSAAVQKVVEDNGFRVVTDYTGHGIGRALHEEPRVPNFVRAGWMSSDPVLERGTAIAIEPMVNVGTHRTAVLPNGWTVVTRDGSLSAHFEHTVAVEEQGAVLLTLP